MSKTHHTAEDLRREQGLHVLGGEEDGDEGGHADEAGKDGPAVAEALRDVAVDEEADDLAAVDTIGETALPLGGDLPCPVRELLAVFPVELIEGN